MIDGEGDAGSSKVSPGFDAGSLNDINDLKDEREGEQTEIGVDVASRV